MRTRFVLLLGWLLLPLAVGCASQGPQVPAGPALIGIGDSYVAGIGLPHKLWITRVGGTTDRAVLNLGVAGTLSESARRVARLLEPDRDDAVVISTGTNDLRTYGEDPDRLADFRDNLAQAVEEVSAAGCVVLLPPLPVLDYTLYPPADQGTPAAVLAYQRAVWQVARGQNALVADVTSTWNPALMLAADQVHPNALGAATIAASVTRALQGCPR